MRVGVGIALRLVGVRPLPLFGLRERVVGPTERVEVCGTVMRGAARGVEMLVGACREALVAGLETRVGVETLGAETLGAETLGADWTGAERGADVRTGVARGRAWALARSARSRARIAALAEVRSRIVITT